MSAFLLACSSDLEVKTRDVEAGCFADPEAPLCAKKTLNLGFEILTKSFVTNAKDADFEWESMGEGFAYELVTATDTKCSNVVDSFFQFENTRKVGLLGNGSYYLCVYGERSGKRIAASNNPVLFIVDRSQPVIDSVSYGPNTRATNILQVPKVELYDDTDMVLEWLQKAGPGLIEFKDKNALDTEFSVTVDGTYNLTLAVKDAAGNTAEQDFEMMIDMSAPVVEAGPDQVSSGSPVVVSGSYSGDALEFLWSMESGPEGGLLTFANPSVLATTAMGGVSGTYVVSLTATDAAGNTGSDTLSIVWSQSNNLPQLVPIANQVVLEGQSMAKVDGQDVFGGDKDVDGQTISWRCRYDFVVNGIVADGSPCTDLSGSVFNTTTGVLNWTPSYRTSDGAGKPAPAGRDYEIALIATDMDGSVAEVFTVTVAKNEASPLLASITSQTVAENTFMSINSMDSNTSDDFDVNGDELVYSCRFDTVVDGNIGSSSLDCTNPAMGATFNPLTGLLSWLPAFDKAGSYEVQIVANDGFGQSDEAYFDISVSNVNRAPSLAAIPDQTVQESIGLLVVDATDVSGGDTDVDGDALTYSCLFDLLVDGSMEGGSSCDSLPGVVSFNTSSGFLNWTPDYSAAGSYEVHITASDGNLSDNEIFIVTIENTNRPPEITTVADATVYEEQDMALIDVSDTSGGDTDIDGANLNYTCVYDHTDNSSTAGANACSGLNGLTFNSVTGKMNWVPEAGITQLNTIYEFAVTASDGWLADTEFFVLTVVDNIPPTDPSAAVVTELNSFAVSVAYTNSADSNFSNYEVKLCSNSGCDTNCRAESTGLGSPTDLSSEVGVGSYYACVRSVDLSGNYNPGGWIASSLFTIDVNVGGFESLPGFAREGIPLSWTDGDPNGSTGFIIYRQDSGNGSITWEPTPTLAYTTTSDVTAETGADSSSRIIYVGAGLSHKDTMALVDNTTYLYKIFAFNSHNEYSAGIERLSRSYPDQSLDIGNFSTCATRFGRVRCWGANETGQLGYGDTATVGDDEYPYEKGDVNVGQEVLDVRVGANISSGAKGHSCALTTEGRVRCWGWGESGRTGYNSSNDLSSPGPDLPIQYSGESANIIMVDTGSNHTCVLTNRGGVQCFGSNNQGQLGYDDTVNRGVAGTEIEDLVDVNDSLPGTPIFVMISTGEKSTCAVTASSKGRCWGNNNAGVLGQDTGSEAIGNGSTDAMSSIDDIAVGDITTISTHNHTTCAVTTTNTARCWGQNYRGRLGYNNTTSIGDGNVSIAAAVDLDVDLDADNIVADILTSGITTCMLSTSGQMKCWGQNDTGSNGYGDDNHWGDGGGEYPSGRSWFDFGSKVIHMAGGAEVANSSRICALNAASEIYCWGNASHGSLGNKRSDSWGNDLGELASEAAPVPVWGPVSAVPDKVWSSHLKLWLDFNDASTVYNTADCTTILAYDQSSVGCIKDKSGLDNHAIQSQSSEQGQWIKHSQHGKSSILLDGVDDTLTGTINGMAGGDTNYTIFVVYRSNEDSSIDYGTVYSIGNASANHQNIHLNYGNWEGSQRVAAHWGNDRRFGNGFADTTYITAAAYSGSGGADISIFDDGLFANTDPQGYPESLSLASNPSYTLGGFTSGEQDRLFSGHMMEIIVYDTVLLEAERLVIEAYLRAKWQKGVDGVATNALALHLDPMKRGTVMTDSNATNCVAATHTPANDGDAVSCLLDRSARGDHAGNATITNRPILNMDGINSQPTLTYNGSSTYLQGELSSFMGSDSPWHIQQIFYSSEALLNAKATFGFGDVDAYRQRFEAMIMSSTNLRFDMHSGAVDYPGLADLNGAARIHSYTYLGGNYGDVANALLYLDGLAQPGTQMTTPGPGQFPENPLFAVGANSMGANHYYGQIGETLFYERPLSTAEIVENDLYMQRKWGLLNSNQKGPGGVTSGLTLWLDASEVTTVSTGSCASSVVVPTDGDAVQCWFDKSGMNNHLSSLTDIDPTYQAKQFNGLGVLNYTNSPQGFGRAELIGMNGGNDPFTVIIVFDLADSNVERRAVSFGDWSDFRKGWSACINYHSDNKVLHDFYGRGAKLSENIVLTQANTTAILTFGYDGSTVDSLAGKTMYENGVGGSTLTSNGSSSGPALIPENPPVAIGALPDGSSQLRGNVAEAIIYNRLLSDHERQQVEAYLAQKWLEEPYPRSCQQLYDEGKRDADDGDYIIDPDGYNGPLSAATITCDFAN